MTLSTAKTGFEDLLRILNPRNEQYTIANNPHPHEIYSAFWTECISKINYDFTFYRNSALTNEFKRLVHEFVQAHDYECKCEYFRIDHVVKQNKGKTALAIEHENQGIDFILKEEVPKLRDINSAAKAVVYYQPSKELNEIDCYTYDDITREMYKISKQYYTDSSHGNDSIFAITGIPVTHRGIGRGAIYVGHIITNKKISDPFQTFIGFNIEEEKIYQSQHSLPSYQQAQLTRIVQGLSNNWN